MAPRRSVLIVAATALLAQPLRPGAVDILRDRWGTPHVFAAAENDGFHGVGYATAEDRLLQMELFRRRARGRLAEVFGPAWVDSDRRFRIAGIGRHCDQVVSYLPAEVRGYLRSYAAGVNAFTAANPEKAQRRLAPLGVALEPWTPGDSICAWMGPAEVFDSFIDEPAIQSYREFQQLVADAGEREALASRGMVIDDAAAVVSESEMAKDRAVYALLKATAPTLGFWRRSFSGPALTFSHAWAVDGTRSVTGKPILQSDPQTSVNNPPLWHEYHLQAGRFDVRGIGFAGSPGLLIGFNTSLAWGATALGAGSTVTFLERLSPDGTGYLDGGRFVSFERRVETIAVRGAAAVTQEVLTNRHGFVFNPLVRQPRPGEAYVSHYRPIQEKGTSVRALLAMMAAPSLEQFRAAMEHYYSPGLHVVYADRAGNIAYQTLVHVPLTPRTARLALEGWTGQDEVLGRIPLAHLPRMLNPDSHFVSHANNLPVGSWYPHDLGISTGGIGHTARSLRLIQLLAGDRQFSLESFESGVHRDDVHSAVAALLPVAAKVVEENQLAEPPVRNLLDRLKTWDLRYRAGDPAYRAATAIADALLLPYRRSSLATRLGGGEGGLSHLARLLTGRPASAPAPQDQQVRDYLLAWLRQAAEQYARGSDEPEVHPMPYQVNGPLRFPSLDARLDLSSPPLSCGQGSTIWSQRGNSFTQIVDLADPDRSRTLLPPGISEDPESPFHADQMDLWVRGETHPAPLSRAKVEEITVSRLRLEVPASQVPAPPRRRQLGL